MLQFLNNKEERMLFMIKERERGEEGTKTKFV